jgi:hypothetical protein
MGRTPSVSAETADRHRDRGEVRPPRRNAERSRKTGEKVIIPTPEEWAEQQLRNAAPRSEEWVNAIFAPAVRPVLPAVIPAFHRGMTLPVDNPPRGIPRLLVPLVHSPTPRI